MDRHHFGGLDNSPVDIPQAVVLRSEAPSLALVPLALRTDGLQTADTAFLRHSMLLRLKSDSVEELVHTLRHKLERGAQKLKVLSLRTLISASASRIGRRLLWCPVL